MSGTDGLELDKGSEANESTEAEGTQEASTPEGLNVEGQASEGQGSEAPTSDHASDVTWVEQTFETIKGHLPEKVKLNGEDVPFGEVGQEQLEPLLKFVNEQKVDPKAFLDFQIQQQTKMWETEAQQAAAMREEMLKNLHEDSSIGGTNWSGTKERVLGFLDRFADKEFKEFLAQSGGQNYLPVVRFLNKVAQVVPKDGGPASGQGADTSPKPMFDRLFTET